MSAKEKGAQMQPQSLFPELYKDTKISFQNRTTQRIYELFLSGEKLTVVTLSKRLSIPDPRSHIRYIRNAGVNISDYWERGEFYRYKVYFIWKGGII